MLKSEVIPNIKALHVRHITEEEVVVAEVHHPADMTQAASLSTEDLKITGQEAVVAPNLIMSEINGSSTFQKYKKYTTYSQH